jgi:predicted methyltransferase
MSAKLAEKSLGGLNLHKLKTAAALCAGLAIAFAAGAAPSAPKYITAAVADSGRPAADTARDPLRKPVDMMVFAGVHPGERVLELIPGGGYFERIFSVAIGPKGTLVEAIPVIGGSDASPKSNGIAKDAHYTNIAEIPMTPYAIGASGPYDLIWTSQNYHDLHLTRLKIDIAALDKVLFASLKHGGVMVIVDHAATPGSGITTTDALHRIDEDLVKSEMKAAGFVLVAESNVLRNPADDHTQRVFSMHDKTDQFVLRWRKP